MRKQKISVYVTDEQKLQLVELAQDFNLTLSQYLLQRGLERPIASSRQKAGMASIACQLYWWADTIENVSLRKQAKEFGGKIYGVLEDQT